MSTGARLGIYIQVPFCQTKCTYCNFHTGPVEKSLYTPFVDAVCREIEMWRSEKSASALIAVPARSLFPLAGSRRVRPDAEAASCQAAGVQELFADGGWLELPVDTVYVGGGTPSLLEPAALGRILQALRENFCCAWEEVTLEADPETITPEKAAAWRDAGFNRISLGVQSFHDGELRAAGRMHRCKDIFAAIEYLRATGFDNVSADLIAGLPHQTDESWHYSMGELLRLRPEHISIYMMEIDEGSRLGREVLAGGARYSAGALPDDDAMARFYEQACERLAAEGYEHYEISNWALPERSSRHNLKYWRREAYLGVGAGAHSFNGRTRWANAHDPAAYVAAIREGRHPIEQIESVTAEQALEEELFLGLRLLEGIDVERLEQQYNVALAERLAGLRDCGLIEFDDRRARLSPSRLTVSNEVFTRLLS